MPKEKNLFRCRQCAYQQNNWLGRCPECGSWNSLQQVKTVGRDKFRTTKNRPAESLPLPLSKIEVITENRIDTGMAEMNRALGGGMMRGSAALIGGEPGIGKSTLMLQLLSTAKSDGKKLYVSGEESATQIKMRAKRLKIDPRVEVLCASEMTQLTEAIDNLKPTIIVIDSIQTLYNCEIGIMAGVPNQIKHCAGELIELIRATGAALFLVAHVTKEGAIAGPKLLEHLVDTVLYFDQSENNLRFLRVIKNRYGSVAEIAIFSMRDDGLQQVADPAAHFLVKRQGKQPFGVAVGALYEGSRVLLVEIEALVVVAKGGLSRVYSEKIDSRRVARVAAVLEKQLSITFSDRDIYINVAGGLRTQEVGVELALALALYSARAEIALPSATAVAGEISLTGEVREAPRLAQRKKSAVDLGFKNFVSGSRQPQLLANEIGEHTIKAVVAQTFGRDCD